jgi:hypothetical protein
VPRAQASAPRSSRDRRESARCSGDCRSNTSSPRAGACPPRGRDVLTFIPHTGSIALISSNAAVGAVVAGASVAAAVGGAAGGSGSGSGSPKSKGGAGEAIALAGSASKVSRHPSQQKKYVFPSKSSLDSALAGSTAMPQMRSCSLRGRGARAARIILSWSRVHGPDRWPPPRSRQSESSSANFLFPGAPS